MPGDTDGTSAHRRWADFDLSPTVAVTTSLALVVVISLGDVATGPYVVFATFYLLPVAVASWFAGRWAGLAVAVVSALAGVAATSVDPGVVTPAVSVWNGVLRGVTFGVVALIVAFERDALRTIAALASTDALTGLPNRRSFYAHAAAELEHAARTGRHLALAYIDLDGLKQRNDELGHDAGDDMLRRFATTVESTSRHGDVAARVGGDEFCLLLREADADTARMILDRLLAAFDELDPPISFSAGVVAGVPSPTTTVEELVQRADRLVLRAKAAGKHRIESAPIAPVVATVERDGAR